MLKRYLFSALSLLWSILLLGQDTLIVKNGDLNGANSWRNSTVYVLDGEVSLETGILVIQRGTRILAKSKPSDPEESFSGLTIAEGARLIARGSASEPIVFTADEDGFYKRGSWRGISIKGDLAPNSYSGNLSFISIQYAGASEDGISGAALFLENVSERTSLDHIEVNESGGDGIRIHGGTVNLLYTAVTFTKDDAYDWDFGWTGIGLYWFAYHVGRNSFNDEQYNEKSYAIEGKGHPDENGQIAQPKIFNATLIGTSCRYSTNGSNNLGNEAAVCFKDNSGGILANSLIVDFPEGGIMVEDLIEGPDSRQQLESGNLMIANNIWWRFHTRLIEKWGETAFNNTLDAKENGIIVVDEVAEDPNAAFLVQHLKAEGNVITSRGVRANRNGICLALDPRPNLQSNFDTLSSFPYPEDFFFTVNVDNENQKGAFSPDTIWLEEWSLLSQNPNFGTGAESYFDFPDGRRISDKDTLKVYCEDLLFFHNPIESEFPCQTDPDLIASASRRGNKRRPARDKSGDDELLAYIEDWEYTGVYFGCDDPPIINITLLVYDTVPPIIHPIPDDKGGLTATVEDCDEAWLTAITMDTIITENQGPAIQYQFFAEDYSGNTAQLTVLKLLSGELITLYADLDGDGYGRPNLSIDCYGPIPGFVDNNLDCNDNHPAYNIPDPFSNNFGCGYDICENALLLEVGKLCESYTSISLEGASRTIYPLLPESCEANKFFADTWFKFQGPASGRLWLEFKNDFVISASIGFTLELYNGNCKDLHFIDCFSAEYTLTTIVENLSSDEIYYIRVLEPANIYRANFEVCLLDAAYTISNPTCELAEPILPIVAECTSTNFNLAGAGQTDFFTSACTMKWGHKGVWFSYIPKNKDTINIYLNAIDGNMSHISSIHTYQNECKALTEIACNQVFDNDPFVLAITNFIPGKPILLQLLTDAEDQVYTIEICQASATTSTSLSTRIKPTIRLFPNPAYLASEVNIEIQQLPSPGKVRCSLLDGQGRTIKEVFDQYLPTGDFNYQMSSSDLAPGVYLLQFQNDQFTVLKKWVIIR